MKSYVEHANITVRDTDSIIEFIRTAVVDFTIRKRWSYDGFEWTHIGTESSYVALMHPLNCAKESMSLDHHDPSATGFNHICVVISDVEDARRRLLAAGYQGSFNNGDVISTSVRKSIYFDDPDGRQWEFMEYLTDNMDERNSYEI